MTDITLRVNGNEKKVTLPPETPLLWVFFRLPGMNYAALSRCPTIGGKVTGFDDKESKKISGLSYVGKISDSAGLRGD
jgi:hypothetical protein